MDAYSYKKEETPNKIIDGLYLGNYSDSEKRDVLLSKGIKYILIAGKYLRANFPKDFKYLQFEIYDETDQDISKYFEAAINFIREGIEAGGCFVHWYNRINLSLSAAGISRSTSFVIAYLMKEKMWKLHEAFKYVAECRRFVFPNYGFQLQLKRFEVFLGLITEDECEKEIIDKGYYLLDF